jgi:PAS domain S-box-containing protein
VQALRGRQVTLEDMVIRHPERDVPLQIWASPVAAADGTPEFAIAAFVDISRRREIEAALHQSRELYRGLVETTSAIPWELDPATERFLYIGPQAVALFGYPIERWCEEPFHAVHVQAHDRERYVAQLRRAAKEGRGFEAIYRCQTADGRSLDIRLVVSAVTTPAGSVLRGLIFDVTAQVMMEVELRQAQKLESVGRLAAGIAHEINTPVQFVSDNTMFLKTAFAKLLATVSAARDLAARGGAAADAGLAELQKILASARVDYLIREVPQAIDQSIEGLQRIATIVGAMKEFSHPSSGEKEGIDIGHALQTTVTVARSEWKHVAAVELSLDPDLPPVPGLRDELNQVFLNLLVNAAHAVADATRDGATGLGSIRITTARDADWCIVRVVDTGCGIPHGVRDRIFEPFFTTKPVGKGTGQGLAIAYNVVVKKHGGRIAVDSQVGQGTTFEVRLPLGD